MLLRSVGDVISILRKINGIDDVDLAHESNMKVERLRSIESGTPPTEEELKILAEKLNTKPQAIELISGDLPDNIWEEILKDPNKYHELVMSEFENDGSKTDEDKNDFNKNIASVFKTEHGRLYKGDCLNILEYLDEKVDCIFADPPFNLDKDYRGVDDDVDDQEYLRWSTRWIDKSINLLKEGGAFYLYNIPKWNIHLGHYLNRKLNFRHWITVNIKYTLPIRNRLYPAHYSLLFFTKGSEMNHFDPPRLPVETCRHCGGEIHDYGGYKDKLNSEGLNLTDVWHDIEPVRHKKYKNSATNQLPIKLIHRILNISTQEGDLVLDPFGGGGTTYATAEIMKRNWIGVEYSRTEIIKERLQNPEVDKERIEKIENEYNVLFTQPALKKRKENKDHFNFDFQSYDLSDSPTKGIISD